MAPAYLDLVDFLLIAEAVLGIPAERIGEMPRVVELASSSLAVPASGWGGVQAYPDMAQKAGLLASSRGTIPYPTATSGSHGWR